MKLSFKETVYMLIIWLLRQLFKTNYDDIKKTKYDINSHADYLFAVKQLNTLTDDVDNYVRSERYVIESFGDISELIDEIMRYEYSNGIDWLTMDDKVGITHWREYNECGIKTGLFDSLRHKILMEFF